MRVRPNQMLASITSGSMPLLLAVWIPAHSTVTLISRRSEMDKTDMIASPTRPLDGGTFPPQVVQRTPARSLSIEAIPPPTG